MSSKSAERDHNKTRMVTVGKTYRITDGSYKGRLAKVDHLVANSRGFAVVNLLDAFGKPTDKMDAVPVKYME